MKYCPDCKSSMEEKVEFVQINTTGVAASGDSFPIILSSLSSDPNSKVPLGTPVRRTYWHCKNPECGSIEIIE